MVARKMMKMVLDINKTNFDGNQTVTCYSCHRGETSVAGVAPFTVRTSYLDDNHFGTTRTLTEVKQNRPIDDGRFDAPVVSR